MSNLNILNTSDISWQIYITKISGQSLNSQEKYIEIDSSYLYANNTNIYGNTFIGDLSGIGKDKIDSSLLIVNDRLDVIDNSIVSLETNLFSVINSNAQIIDTSMIIVDNCMSIVDASMNILDKSMNIFNTRLFVLYSYVTNTIDNCFQIIHTNLDILDNSVNQITNRDITMYGNKTIIGDICLNGILRGPNIFYIDPGPYGISNEIGKGGTVIIRGNLQVDGSQTIVNSTQVDISDKTVVLASNANNLSETDNAGLEIYNANGVNPSILYNYADNYWNLNSNIKSDFFIGDISGVSRNRIDNSISIINTRLGTIDNSLFVIDNSVSILDSRATIIDYRATIVDYSLAIVDNSLGIIDNSIDQITNKNITFYGNKQIIGNIDLSGILYGPSQFFIDPSPYGNNSEIGKGGTVIIRGNLQVDGSQTIVNSTQVEITDKNIILARDASNLTQADRSGIEIHNQLGDNPSILYTYPEDSWVFNSNIKSDFFIGDISGKARDRIEIVDNCMSIVDTSMIILDNSMNIFNSRLFILYSYVTNTIDNCFQIVNTNLNILDNSVNQITNNDIIMNGNKTIIGDICFNGILYGSSNYSSNSNYHNWYTNSETNTKRMELNNNDLIVRGNITPSGFSDIRLKNILGNIEDPINKIKNIETFYYKENDIAKTNGFYSEKIKLGVSAQSVQNVLPELVDLAFFDRDNTDSKKSKSGENYLSVDYIKLIPVLIESIKKQQEKIELLELNLLNLQNKE